MDDKPRNASAEPPDPGDASSQCDADREGKALKVARLEAKFGRHKPGPLAQARQSCGDADPERVNREYVRLRVAELLQPAAMPVRKGPPLPRETAANRRSTGFRIPGKKPGRNYLVRHWRGELSLPVSYWVNVVVVSIIATALYVFLDRQMSGSPVSLTAIRVTFLVIIAAIPVSVWQLVGCWRSARNHKRTGQRPAWGTVAQVMLILGVLSVVVEWQQRYPALVEIGKVAVGRDELSEYEIKVLEGGEEVEITGFIGFGIRDDLDQVLARNDGVWLVHLNSPGGRLAPARNLRDLIEARELVTYSATECDSACIIAFMGAATRILHTDARLGFHASHMPGLTPEETRADDEQDKAYFVGKGVERAFLDKAFSVPSSELWYPEIKVLAEAGVVTHVYDGAKILPAGPGTDGHASRPE